MFRTSAGAWEQAHGKWASGGDGGGQAVVAAGAWRKAHQKWAGGGGGGGGGGEPTEPTDQPCVRCAAQGPPRVHVHGERELVREGGVGLKVLVHVEDLGVEHVVGRTFVPRRTKPGLASVSRNSKTKTIQKQGIDAQ